ncbi:MAG: hypothetical protein ABR520_04250 [Mycobacteriales bacterium]|nr:hypothetical protein [Frankia sp.]
MTVVSLARTRTPRDGGLEISAHAVAKPALASQIRPAIVLTERDARDLLNAAALRDVAADGRFSAGPAGVQVWSGPFDGDNGAHGTAVHLGSVDWSYNTPVKHYATIYRAMVTAAGVAAGETTETVLGTVLTLVGLSLDGSRVQLARPPATDPFAAGRQAS